MDFLPRPVSCQDELQKNWNLRKQNLIYIYNDGIYKPPEAVRLI